MICDSRIEGDPAAFARLSDYTALGLIRIPMSRRFGLGDLNTAAKVRRLAAQLGVDVLHGHGAKGGVHARLAARKLKRKDAKVKAIYTPHGGSLHSSPSRPSGRLQLTAERMLKSSTDGLVFESTFAAKRYIELIGQPRCPGRIVPNGLNRHEFYEPMLSDDAVDFVFIGELRRLKGVDILLEALAAHQSVFPGRALVVGRGRTNAVSSGSPAGLALIRASRSPGSSRRAPPFAAAAASWCRHGPNPFPTSCWRRPALRCR